MNIYRPVPKHRWLRHLYIGLPINICMKDQHSRPLCKHCNARPRAIAYYKYNRVYYRSLCDVCLRRGRKLKATIPRWKSAGYKKKTTCDRCGFRARHHSQLTVYHVDGNLNNCNLGNLKTVCLNCAVEVTRLDLPWRRGDLEPDY